jgi:PAS domain S-box-containing protein
MMRWKFIADGGKRLMTGDRLKHLRQKNLANKIILMVAIITSVLTGLFTIYYTLHGRYTLENYSKASGLSFVQSLAQSSLLGIMASEPLFLDQTFNIAQSNPEVVFIAAYDANGTIIRKFSKIPVNLSLSKGALAVIKDADGATTGNQMHVDDVTIDDFYAPVRSPTMVNELSDEVLAEPGKTAESAMHAVGLIRVGFSTERIQTAQRTSTIVGLIIGCSVLAFGILVTFILGRKITDPLKELEAGTKRISEGDLEVALDVKTNDEVGSVARAFNAMAAALRATTVSKHYVDNIVGSMNEAMVVVDADRKIEMMNAATEKLLGYSAAELTGTAIDALFTNASAHPFSDVRWKRVIARAASNIDAEYRSKDGHRIPVSVSSAPMVDSHGTPRGLVLIARDMREINSLLEQLRSHASELERYQSVLLSMLDDNEHARNETESERIKTLAAINSMAEGLIMFAGADNDIALINPAAKSMLAIDPQTHVNPDQIITALGPALKPFITGRADMQGNRLVHDINVGTSQARAIRVEGIPVGQGDSTLGIMLVMRDITKERKLDEAKYELISNVSHELRTPLAIISNIVSNLLVGIAGPLPEKVKTSLETCSSNTMRLSHIIDELLSTASLDAGQVIIRPGRTDVTALVTELAGAFRDDAEKRGLRLELDLPDGVLISYLDPNIVHDVLENLINNALRFTPQGGTVNISAKHEAQSVAFAVTDTGIGIPPEEQISIFEHFHQVGRTYGPGEKGVGLGLSISRLLVQRHHGSIGVASSPGKGSRFYFSIPDPAGEELMALFLKDALQTARDGKPEPYLATFVAAFHDQEQLKPDAPIVQKIEKAVELVLKDLEHVVSRSSFSGEVLAAFQPQESFPAEAILKNLKEALNDIERKETSIHITTVSIPCSPSVVPPSQHFIELRKILQRDRS